jgi:hypothetical protein
MVFVENAYTVLLSSVMTLIRSHRTALNADGSDKLISIPSSP